MVELITPKELFGQLPEWTGLNWFNYGSTTVVSINCFVSSPLFDGQAFDIKHVMASSLNQLTLQVPLGDSVDIAEHRKLCKPPSGDLGICAVNSERPYCSGTLTLVTSHTYHISISATAQTPL